MRDSVIDVAGTRLGYREAGFLDDVAEAPDLAGNEKREQLCEIAGTGPRACALCSVADDIFLRIMGCLSMAVASF